MVHLAEKADPIEIHASRFEVQDDTIRFYMQKRDMFGGAQHEWALEEIYVRTSEVLAIVPSDGIRVSR